MDINFTINESCVMSHTVFYLCVSLCWTDLIVPRAGGGTLCTTRPNNTHLYRPIACDGWVWTALVPVSMEFGSHSALCRSGAGTGNGSKVVVALWSASE